MAQEPTPQAARSRARVDEAYALEDRYTRERGRVYLNGVQALVRLPMMQRQRDRAAGLETAGFISGYRGSPLGTYDMALWQAREQLAACDVRFEPGVNEDLAATAVWGSQQVSLHDRPRRDGVFGIWYGKGPGVDRSCDALKHANYAGTSRHGGVLALTGDDPGARSSSIAHQSEHALIHCGIPVLNPSNLQDYLDLGLYGFALSRFSGCWVGFKCLTDTVDSSGSVEVGPERVRVVLPEGFDPDGGRHIQWANVPLAVEQRLYQQRLPAAQAFVRANGLDRVALDAPRRRLGIVTTGKAYLDVRQALDELGVDAALARELGLAVYKVAMTWPLEPRGLDAFAAGLHALLVVEEKRPILEGQIAQQLYNRGERPRLEGKTDADGAPLLPSEGELSPLQVAEALRRWIGRHAPDAVGRLRPPAPPPEAAPAGLMRLPSFCSGCPHNRSTVVPEGSIALGGIGCHGMVAWMPERRTLAVTQMGGEGANWIGQAPFVETPHIFQNLGDGTYFHSGLLAIRAAVTAGVDITYKVLANGAVAMTGGQPIEGEQLEGEVTVPEIARQLAAEGVARIAVVGDAPDKYPRGAGFPSGVTFHSRREIDRVQRELREVPGVTALIYDQTCAAEARRLRKRGEFPDPDLRVVINELVCEGCGDCSEVSNCISVEPVETEFGRKRRINQSSCNKDYSCLEGYCPSFVSIEGGRMRRAGAAATDPGGDAVFAGLPEPAVAACDAPFDVLVGGIGGSGVVTVGALLGMAAHLEGKGCSVLDVTGLAQKNGPVTSHVRIADDPDRLHATRIAAGAADLVLGCDLVVVSGADALSRMSSRTTAVLDTRVAPTADFASHPDLDLTPDAMLAAVRRAAGDAREVDAARLATSLLGDAIATNLFLVGYAAQLGRLPVSLRALERAIELNGRAVEMNKRALAWGRLAAHDPGAVDRAAAPERPALGPEGSVDALEALVERRSAYVTAYQDAAYARRYREFVARVAERERAACGGPETPLAETVARYLFKLMAYKDEYEVARLYTDGSFRRQLERDFEGDYRVSIHLAPQFLPRFLGRDESGRARKWKLGPWMFAVLRILARLRFLRGTAVDPFGWTEHRRLERRLISRYRQVVDGLLDSLTAENRELAVAIAALPEHIRGFDTVKERHLEEVRSKEAELLAAFRLRAPGAPE